MKKKSEERIEGKRARPKVQICVRLDPELAERLHNLIFHTGRGRTVQGLAESAIQAAVEEIERDEHGGRPFPARSGDIAKSRKST